MAKVTVNIVKLPRRADVTVLLTSAPMSDDQPPNPGKESQFSRRGP
jgi:hypothetical protein